MATKIRKALCGCCNQDSAARSKENFPLGKQKTCVSVGAQTDEFKCRSYYQQENQYGNQYGYQPDYPQDYFQNYPQDYPQDYQNACVDPCAQYYDMPYDSGLGSRSYDEPVSSHCKYDNRSGHQDHKEPSMSQTNGYSELGNQKSDAMRCRYDPLSSRFINDVPEVTRDGDGNKADGADAGKLDGNAMNDANVMVMEKGAVKETGSSHHLHKRGGHPGKHGGHSKPSGLTRTTTVMHSNMSPFPNRGPFSSNSRPYSSLPYFRSRSGSDPSSNGHDFGQVLGSARRRASDPGSLHSHSMMEARNRRSHNSTTPLPRPPETTFFMPEAKYSETPFDTFPSKGPSDIWQNNNNPQAYLFGWGKKKASKNTGDGSNKLKMLYQINNAGVTCNCGQRMQFNLSVEENAGRCQACFEDLRQDFADLLDLYKEMGYAQCECKGRISVTDLANEYLMDQAKNASGRGYENVGAPRKKGPVKTIELTPTEGFTGCMCREIKVEMFRKPSDLISCQCDSERPKIVLVPPSDDGDYDDDYDEGDDSILESDEPERDFEQESEVYFTSNPSRAGSPFTTVCSALEPKSSAFIESRSRKSVTQSSSPNQSTSSSSAATTETVLSDSSVQSNKTFIITN